MSEIHAGFSQSCQGQAKRKMQSQSGACLRARKLVSNCVGVPHEEVFLGILV